MKAALLLLPALLIPSAAVAQEEPPAGLAEVELARSSSCVAALARLADLDSIARPYALRMERLRALGRAVSLEDRAEAGALGAADSLEAAVDRWFVADSALAARYVAERTEATQEERTKARNATLDAIRAAMQATATEAESKLVDAQAAEEAAQPCDGSIFVRSAVLEACAGRGSELCRAAADTAARGAYRFVDKPTDIWDVEDYRPWTAPGPLQGTPEGALVGARTAAQARRGNVVLGVALAPLLRNRAELDSAQIAEFEANMDSLGFTFEHPTIVMAPAIEIQASVPAPIGGETHVLVHFGDLSGDDVVWNSEVGKGGLLRATFPASRRDLARLEAGDPLSLTAVRLPPGENPTAEPVYTVPLLQVGQSQSVGALLQYMRDGGLARDLAALVPPQPPGAPGR